MKINETDWCGHVVQYVQYFWCEAEWVEHDTKIAELPDEDYVEQEFSFSFSEIMQNW